MLFQVLINTTWYQIPYQYEFEKVAEKSLEKNHLSDYHRIKKGRVQKSNDKYTG